MVGDDPQNGLPAGAGTIVFAGGGAWLPSVTPSADRWPENTSLLLTQPESVCIAHDEAEVADVLRFIDAQQGRGRYVAGYLAYEAGAAFGLATKIADGVPSIPIAWMAAYAPETVTYRSPHPDSEAADDAKVGDDSEAVEVLPASLDVSYEEYVDAIARVREFIAAGDTYQVNYTVRARFDLHRHPLQYFLERAHSHPVPYGAYIDLGDAQVISLSPELFLQRYGDIIESRPMKGTRPRGVRPADDIALAYELIGSEKDRAEDLMIVDMVRNDLGRVCVPGSVYVPALYTVEPYRTVWQMSSTVRGRLQPRTTVADIMAATFPGASITGAPKHHTMEIIRDLEKAPRGVYTGSVGLFFPGGDFTCNLCIRTIVHGEGRGLLGVGSGVVWDSDAHEEYEETLTKAAFAFSPGRQASRPPTDATGPGTATEGLFETILLQEDGGSAPLLRYRFVDEHLARMSASAKAWDIAFAEEEAREQLSALALDTAQALVVRLDLAPDGTISLRTRPCPAPPETPVTILVSPFRTDPEDRLLRHKTSVRPLYDRERERATAAGFFEVLFANRLDHVTEGAITNVCARFGTRWITPPLADGLLPGIWRAHFLQENDCEEHSLTLDELVQADEIVLGNSVRGQVRVDEIVFNTHTGLFA